MVKNNVSTLHTLYVDKDWGWHATALEVKISIHLFTLLSPVFSLTYIYFVICCWVQVTKLASEIINLSGVIPSSPGRVYAPYSLSPLQQCRFDSVPQVLLCCMPSPISPIFRWTIIKEKKKHRKNHSVLFLKKNYVTEWVALLAVCLEGICQQP